MSGVIIQILALVLVTRIAESSDLDDHGLGRNFSHVLKSLMTNYDPRLRPNFGRGPLYVGMDLAIASFDAISEVNMDFTLTLNLNQYWKDERLSFSSKHEVFTLAGDFSEKIWVPDTFFPNDKHSYLHDVTEKNKMVKLHGDGSIAYGMRFTTTLSCMMDLHYYPLDYQNCTIEIESYGYAEEDVAMYWKEMPATGIDKLELQQFTIMEYRAIDKKIKLATGTYQRLSLSFKLSRSIGYFIIQTYLPVILIVMLSWVSFWINHEATPARVALGITTVLTMTTISTGVRSSLPRISYIKAIDIYLVMGFVFVFAALLEYAAVNYTNACRNAKKQKAAIAEKAAAEKAKEKPAEKPTEDKPPISISLPAVFTPDGKDDLFPVEDFPPMCDHGFEGHDAFSHYHHQASHQHDVRRRNFGSPSEPSLVQSAVSAIKAKAPEVKKFFELKDVSDIDRYARMVFPASFLVFNAFYWVFYTMKANATEP